jgi:hypothetical protein
MDCEGLLVEDDRPRLFERPQLLLGRLLSLVGPSLVCSQVLLVVERPLSQASSASLPSATFVITYQIAGTGDT